MEAGAEREQATPAERIGARSLAGLGVGSAAGVVLAIARGQSIPQYAVITGANTGIIAATYFTCYEGLAFATGRRDITTTMGSGAIAGGLFGGLLGGIPRMPSMAASFALAAGGAQKAFEWAAEDAEAPGRPPRFGHDHWIWEYLPARPLSEEEQVAREEAARARLERIKKEVFNQDCKGDCELCMEKKRLWGPNGPPDTSLGAHGAVHGAHVHPPPQAPAAAAAPEAPAAGPGEQQTSRAWYKRWLWPWGR
eukprot:tig00020629_g12418.t1